MGINMSTKRTGFYNELSPDNQKEYFNLKRDKSVAMIDNLYYTVFVTNDSKEDIPLGLQRLIDELETNKTEAIKLREPIRLEHGLYYHLKSYHNYGYCVGNPDLYDIFVCKSLPNDETPRIMVQIRAFGLWTRGTDSILSESYEKVETLLADYSCTVDWCRESRIDYCYHTNSISNMNTLFKEDSRGKVKSLHTNLKNVTWNADIEHEEDGTVFSKDYLCFGRIKSNNIRARIYNKVKEVIEMGYKSFFFNIWYENGLISYYDKFCMEYAFEYKNIDYLSKAALAFYVEHGTDHTRRQEYSKALTNPKTTLAQFKTLAAKHMPKVTTILNIEYETKRKFYYYSDHFINGFKLSENRGNIAKPMERIYKILEYRSIFLDYLTSKTLSFYSSKDKNGEPKYLAWWERLRNTKHEGKKVDFQLVRDYSYAMDKKAVQKRAINSIASNAVYEDRIDTGFVADLSDMLADISDNKAYEMLLVSEDGNILDSIHGSVVSDYLTVKAKKEMLLKNRKKRQAEQLTTQVESSDFDNLKDKYDELNNRHFNQQNKPVIDITDCIVGEILSDEDDTYPLPIEF